MGRAGLRTGRRARVAVSAAVAVVTLGGAGARWAAAGTWAHDPATVGDWFTAANWQPASVPYNGDYVTVNNGGTAQVAAGNVVVGELHLGSAAAGAGTVSVTGGAFIWSYGGAYVGENGVGRFVQTGGRVNDPTAFSPSYYGPGLLYVGYNSGATGTYELGGTGRLGTSSTSAYNWHDEYVGYYGLGSFVQTGGTHYLTNNALYMGYEPGSAGVYSLSGGRLSAVQGASVYVGYYGGGRFLQSGGTFAQLATSPSLYVGSLGGFGRYELSGGTMSGVTESVGTGYFAQSGGTNGATSLSVGSRGRYAMAGGSLTAGSASVGGTMSQTGGAVSAGSLTVGVGGRYELLGGSLSATNLRNDGVLAFGAPGVGLSAGGLVDFAHGTLVGAPNANVTIQPGALVIVPAGFDPATTFGSFTNQGTLHVAGTTLSVGAGQGFTGAGAIDDFVNLNGGTMSGQISYTGGLNARGAASVFNGGTLSVEGSTVSGVADTAQVTFSGMTIAAKSGVGTFVQSGGQDTVGRLVVESGGRYVLSGGTLAVTSGLENRGVIDLAGGGGTVSVDGGIADFTQGSLVNTSQGTLAGTSSASLVLLPAGANPAAMFKSVTTSGLVHVAGTPLAIPAGRTIFGPGTITDHADIAGTVYVGVNLLGGVAVSGTGSVNAGTVLVGDATSGISGGSLSATNMTVGAGASFTQSTGSLSGSSLTVVGRYALGDGRMSPTYLRVRDGGTVVQSGGTNASFYSYIGDTAGGTGSYTLSAGTMSGASVYVGYGAGTGTFAQSGGTNSVTTYLGTGGAGANGTYALSGGGTLSGTIFAGDNGGTGTVVQTGGTKTGSVYLGRGAGSTGTYRLDAGELSPNGALYVGYGGTGVLVQTGGTVSNGSSTAYVGLSSGSSGTYELRGGSLSAGGLTVGSSGAGTVVQSGGANTLSGSLVLAQASTATGRYELSGGALTAPTQTIGISFTGAGETAAFVQTGGSNTANLLTVNLSGRYAMSGGTLSVAQGIVNSGVVDFSGGTGPGVTVGGVTDFTQGTWLNLGQASVTGLAGSLIIVPAGFDVGTGFKAFANSGVTHVAGTPLAIGAGETYTWGGTIGDRVDVAGTVAGGVSGRPLQLRGGVTVSGAGSLASATVRVDGTGSGISGGQISSGTLYVGDAGVGTFEQTGGTCAPSTLIVGNLAGSAGTYLLSAGALKGTGQTIGAAGAGTLSQSGGTNTASTLVIGNQGVYRLSGGSLAVTSGMTLRGTLDLAGSAAAVTIGGIADWAGGSIVDAGQASLTTNAGSLLIVPAGFDPGARFGTFAAGGMVHTLGTTLDVPAGVGVTGSGVITDPAVVGGSVSGLGSLSLTGGVTVGSGGRVVGGTLTVNGPVSVGAGATLGALGTLIVGGGGAASMTVTGGLVSSTSAEIVGNGAGDSGTVSQSGGTNSVVRSLNVGYGAGSQGRYVLSGGDVLARPTSTFPTSAGGLISVGSAGQGTFVQTGGRVMADAGASTFVGFPSSSAGLTLGAQAGGSGTYEMDGGELTVDAEWLGAPASQFVPPLTSGGTGVLLQRGGVHTVRNALTVRGASVVDVSGGTLDVGDLDISGNAAALAFELNGPAGAIGFAASAREAAVDGSLHVRLGAGFDPAAVSAGDQFLLLDTYAVIGGAFDNVASGSRLVTDDGRGSFVVSYGLASPFGADRLVLSDFVAVPEPGGVGAAVVMGLAVTGRRRRRVR